MGLFGLCAQLTLPKNWSCQISLSVWIVANYLAVNGPLYISFTNSYQNFDNPWAAKSHAKKLASQFW
jgi:hypothetical protein